MIQERIDKDGFIRMSCPLIPVLSSAYMCVCVNAYIYIYIYILGQEGEKEHLGGQQ